jgi:hypothetical protein
MPQTPRPATPSYAGLFGHPAHPGGHAYRKRLGNLLRLGVTLQQIGSVAAVAAGAELFLALQSGVLAPRAR